MNITLDLNTPFFYRYVPCKTVINNGFKESAIACLYACTCVGQNWIFLRLWYIVTAGPVVNKELLGGIMPDKKVQNLFR